MPVSDPLPDSTVRSQPHRVVDNVGRRPVSRASNVNVVAQENDDNTLNFTCRKLYLTDKMRHSGVLHRILAVYSSVKAGCGLKATSL